MCHLKTFRKKNPLLHLHFWLSIEANPSRPACGPFQAKVSMVTKHRLYLDCQQMSEPSPNLHGHQQIYCNEPNFAS